MATFAVMLLACVHTRDNTRFIATSSEKYSVADVFREINKEILKRFYVTGLFGADSYEINFSSPV
jgi:hypothetical protein